MDDIASFTRHISRIVYEDILVLVYIYINKSLLRYTIGTESLCRYIIVIQCYRMGNILLKGLKSLIDDFAYYIIISPNLAVFIITGNVFLTPSHQVSSGVSLKFINQL